MEKDFSDGSAPPCEWISLIETLAMRVLVVLVLIVGLWLANGREIDTAPCRNWRGQALTGTNVYKRIKVSCDDGHIVMPAEPETGTLI